MPTRMCLLSNVISATNRTFLGVASGFTKKFTIQRVRELAHMPVNTVKNSFHISTTSLITTNIVRRRRNLNIIVKVNKHELLLIEINNTVNFLNKKMCLLCFDY